MKKDRFKPTKMVLYKIVPKIIEEYRLPMSDGSPGRRTGEANADECSGASDILYHLLCDDTIKLMAKFLRVRQDRLHLAIHMGLHSIESEPKQ